MSKNVLYVAHRVPYPPDKGDRIRAFHVLKYLGARSRVHLACLADEPYSDDTLANLRRHAERVAVFPLGAWRWVRAVGSLVRGGAASEGAFRSVALARTLLSWARDTKLDVALASSSAVAPYLRIEELRRVPGVVDLVDVDSQKWIDYAAEARGWRARLYRTEGSRLRQRERQMPSWAQAVTLVSEAEAKLYRQFAVPGPVHVVRNGVDLDYFRPVDTPTEPAVTFVGALDYRPNVDAVCWFCREAWPEIHRQAPATKLRLVGRRPVSAVRRLTSVPGVEVIGQVPDVRPYLARASVVVVPLSLARGLQNKVLEALAMGKAVVASPPALAAIDVRRGFHLLSAHFANEWVDAVLHLLDDETARQRLGAAGRRYVEEHHRWENCLRPLGDLLGLNDDEDAAGAPTNGVMQPAGQSFSLALGRNQG